MRQFFPLAVVSLLLVACSGSKTPAPTVNSSASSSTSAQSVTMYHPPADGDCRPVARFTKTKTCPANTKAQFRDVDAKDGYCLPKGCPVIQFKK